MIRGSFSAAARAVGPFPTMRADLDKEMDVVRVVGIRIGAVRRDLRQVFFIRRDGIFVGRDRILEATQTEVDVRGHMHHVPGAPHERPQPIGV